VFLLVTAMRTGDESGMNRVQMGKHNSSVIVALYGTVCAIPPVNSNGIVSRRDLDYRTVIYVCLNVYCNQTHNDSTTHFVTQRLPTLQVCVQSCHSGFNSVKKYLG
jgi:hypothetical protein